MSKGHGKPWFKQPALGSHSSSAVHKLVIFPIVLINFLIPPQFSS